MIITTSGYLTEKNVGQWIDSITVIFKKTVSLEFPIKDEGKDV